MGRKTGRTPDYDLSALSNSSDLRGKVGAAWINDDGSISIKLNPFVVLNAGEDLQLRLFAYRTKEDWDRIRTQEKNSAATPSVAEPAPKPKFDDMEDDIPF